MTKILFLVSSPGQGHVRCAQAIAAALSQQHRDCQAQFLDIHGLIDRRVSAAIIDGYLRMTAEQPLLYQRLYDLDRDLYRQLYGEIPAAAAITNFLTEQQQRWFPEYATRNWLTHPHRNLDRSLINTLVNGMRQNRGNSSQRLLMRGLLQLIYRVLARRLREFVHRQRPDVIVATQMYPHALLRSARASGQLSQPLIGIITDYGVHGVWVGKDQGGDGYCVAHQHTAEQLQARGIAHDRIAVTGIPLMPDFTTAINQVEARQRLGLPTAGDVVLITGGEYSLGVMEAAKQLLADTDGPTLIITAPRDSDHQPLSTLASTHPQRLHLHPWGNHMAMLMQAADVVVGKPGGLTVSEALACGRPFLASCCLGGQEAHNVHFLMNEQVGLRLEPAALADFLRLLFADRARLLHWQQLAAATGRRHSAEAVAKRVLHHVPECNTELSNYADST